jgi:hypothetical protein
VKRKQQMTPTKPSESQQVWQSVKDLFRGKITRLRHSVAYWVVARMYGKEMSISPYATGAVSACAVFWFMDEGVRKFIFIREKSKGAQARFISVMKNSDTPMNAVLLQAVNRTLGSVFFKSLDHRLFDVDRVAAAPSFMIQDKDIKASIPMLSLVWAVQITKEQAQLCNGHVKNFEVVTIPEFSLISGTEVAEAHKGVYQAVVRHIHGSIKNNGLFSVDALENLLQNKKVAPRTIH